MTTKLLLDMTWFD